MRRLEVIAFLTSLTLFAAASAVAGVSDHEKPAAASHDAVCSSHNGNQPHSHDHDAKGNPCSHTLSGHNAGDGRHGHWGHSFLRWIHNTISHLRGTHVRDHNGQPAHNVTATAHGGGPKLETLVQCSHSGAPSHAVHGGDGAVAVSRRDGGLCHCQPAQ